MSLGCCQWACSASLNHALSTSIASGCCCQNWLSFCRVITCITYFIPFWEFGKARKVVLHTPRPSSLRPHSSQSLPLLQHQPSRPIFAVRLHLLLLQHAERLPRKIRSIHVLRIEQIRFLSADRIPLLQH